MGARRRFLFLLLLAGTGRGEEIAVTLRDRSVYEVAGSFDVPMRGGVPWQVLTDFEGPRYRRIDQIKQLIAAGELGTDLRWTSASLVA